METERQIIQSNVVFHLSLVLEMWTFSSALFCFLQWLFYITVSNRKVTHRTLERLFLADCRMYVLTDDLRNTQKWPTNTQLWHLLMHAPTHAHVQIVYMLHVSCSAVVYCGSLCRKTTLNLCSYWKQWMIYSIWLFCSCFLVEREFKITSYWVKEEEPVQNGLLIDEWKSPGCPRALSNSALYHVAALSEWQWGMLNEWLKEGRRAKWKTGWQVRKEWIMRGK